MVCSLTSLKTKAVVNGRDCDSKANQNCFMTLFSAFFVGISNSGRRRPSSCTIHLYHAILGQFHRRWMYCPNSFKKMIANLSIIFKAVRNHL